jgi:excisionase family DNA binding protein
MAAYATRRLVPTSPSSPEGDNGRHPTRSEDIASSSLLDALIDQLAERVAERLAGGATASHRAETGAENEWLDSRHAADYLGVHRDTLRKLAAERAIPCEQDGPNCKLYFRRCDLDIWRRAGGRPRHVTTTLQRVA